MVWCHGVAVVWTIAVLWSWGGGALYCGVELVWQFCGDCAKFQRGHSSVVVVWWWCGCNGVAVLAIVCRQ